MSRQGSATSRSSGTRKNVLNGCEETEYVNNTLGNVLVNSLTEIATKKPRDPIEYLAKLLYHSAELTKQQQELEKREEELQQALAADAERRKEEAICMAERIKFMKEEANRRKEAAAKQMRQQKLLEQSKMLGAVQWRSKIIAMCDIESQVLEIEDSRKLLLDVNEDYAEKSAEDLLQMLDTNADGKIDYEEMRQYLMSKYSLQINTWEDGPIPSMQKIKEEESAEDGLDDAQNRDDTGKTEFHRWVTSGAPNAAEQIQSLLESPLISLMDRDQDGLTVFDAAKENADNAQIIDEWLKALPATAPEEVERLAWKGFSAWPADWMGEMTDETPAEVKVVRETIDAVQGKINEFFELTVTYDEEKLKAAAESPDWSRLSSAWNADGQTLAHLLLKAKNISALTTIRDSYREALRERNAFGETCFKAGEAMADDEVMQAIQSVATPAPPLTSETPHEAGGDATAAATDGGDAAGEAGVAASAEEGGDGEGEEQ